MAIAFGDPVPFWGAKESSPVGTAPAKLKPGDFIWDAAAAPDGPLVIVVSLPEQIARVYRNGIQVGVAKVSTGKPGHLTPTGIFTCDLIFGTIAATASVSRWPAPVTPFSDT